jgi:hypothetical protein
VKHPFRSSVRGTGPSAIAVFCAVAFGAGGLVAQRATITVYSPTVRAPYDSETAYQYLTLGSSLVTTWDPTTEFFKELLHGGHTRGHEAWVSGEEVASMGDITGDGSPTPDGITDFIVGERGLNSATVYSGAAHYSWQTFSGACVYPFYRGEFTTLFSVTRTTLDADLAGTGAQQTSTSADAFLGWDVANAFDVTDDGINDFIVGAPTWQSPNMGSGMTGAVFVFCGASGDLVAAIFPDTHGPRGDFGFSVAGIGDVDGGSPPLGDIIVGSPNNNGGGPGMAYIFSGATLSPLPWPNLVYTSQADALTASTSPSYHVSGNRFGICVAAGGRGPSATAPDTVVVGAPGVTVGSNVNAGAAFVFRRDSSGAWPLATDPTNSSIVTGVLTGGAQCALLGFDISSTGDVDGDCVDDLVIGAMGRTPADWCDCTSSHQQANGAARLISGYSLQNIRTTYGTSQYVTTSTSPGDDELERYGAYVAGKLDLNTDGANYDFDGDQLPDYLVSSYRKRLDGVTMEVASTSRPVQYPGAVTLYSSAAAVSSNPTLDPTPVYFNPPLVLGHGSMDGRVKPWTYDDSEECFGTPAPTTIPRSGFFGEALAVLPREGSADQPRIAASEIESPFAVSITVIAPYGAMSIEAHPLADGSEGTASGPPDVPRIVWRSGAQSKECDGEPSGNWFDGELVTTLSSTASSAALVMIIPSLAPVAEIVAGTPSPGYVFGLSPYFPDGIAPLYTFFDSGFYQDFGFASGDQDTVHPSLQRRVDFDFGDWFVLAGAGTTQPAALTWNGSGYAVLPFSLLYSERATQFPAFAHTVTGREHARWRGICIYLQVVEYYDSAVSTPLGSSQYKVSNLLILRANPDGVDCP